MSDQGMIKSANVAFVHLRAWNEEIFRYEESVIACKGETRPVEEIQAEFHQPPLSYAKAYRR